MPDILIQGMEMPKNYSIIVAIRPDGKIEDVMGCYIGTAVELPEHGDLVERERVINLINSILDQTYDAEAVHRLRWLRDCARTMVNFALLPSKETKNAN